jgi:hypothetical protein
MLMKDHWSSLEFNRIARFCGLEANPAKQMNDKGTLEYLRLTYYEDGYVLGSLCRALASFVNGNWESDVSVDPIARAQACWEQCSGLLRRGLDSTLTVEILNNTIKFYGQVVTDKVTTQVISPDVTKLQGSDGGLGLGELGTGDLLESGVPVDVDVARVDVELDVGTIKGKLNATNDYLYRLNTEHLPSWATVDTTSTTKPVHNMMSRSTIGLEIPKKAKGTAEMVESVAKVNRTLKKSRKKVKSGCVSAIERHTMVDVVRNAPRILKIRKRKGYYDKMKTFLPYLKFRDGKGKKDFLRYLSREDDEVFSNFNKIVDRTDGGRVPPHAMSMITAYCQQNDIGMDGIVKSYFNDTRMSLVSY